MNISDQGYLYTSSLWSKPSLNYNKQKIEPLSDMVSTMESRECRAENSRPTGASDSQVQSSKPQTTQRIDDHTRQYHLREYQRTQEQLNTQYKMRTVVPDLPSGFRTSEMDRANLQNSQEAFRFEERSLHSCNAPGQIRDQSASAEARQLSAAQFMQLYDIRIDPV